MLKWKWFNSGVFEWNLWSSSIKLVLERKKKRNEKIRKAIQRVAHICATKGKFLGFLSLVRIHEKQINQKKAEKSVECQMKMCSVILNYKKHRKNLKRQTFKKFQRACFNFTKSHGVTFDKNTIMSKKSPKRLFFYFCLFIQNSSFFEPHLPENASGSPNMGLHEGFEE